MYRIFIGIHHEWVFFKGTGLAIIPREGTGFVTASGAKKGVRSTLSHAAADADMSHLHPMTFFGTGQAPHLSHGPTPPSRSTSYPQHVVQRGNNRLPCFLDDDDRRRYLQLLLESLLHTGCRLHAYVLMDNHVHLLLTPRRHAWLLA